MTSERRWSLAAHLLLAALTYAPILPTHAGRVGADTKTYLYLDPGRLLERALTMWDPNTGMGTVTHQTIGYLFPMGPWYWLLDQAGVPDWFAQRMWLATVMFAAGSGVLFLARTLGWHGAGPVVATLSYALSPYVLDYSARISVILLPWAALPWLVGLADRALRRGGWRHPALFALVVLAVGGVNATALVFAGLGPVLWLVFAAARGDAPWRMVAGTAARIGALTTLVSLWWVAGLAVQGAFGIDILRFTETVEVVAVTSLASEVVRGLGYWFFYGNDRLGPWIEPSVTYTQNVPLIALTFALPAVALLAGGLVRWRYRAYCVASIAIGVLIAVGAYPYDSPSLAGRVVKGFATGSTVGLALRSTARAVPLVALGFALLLGAAVTALRAKRPRVGAAAPGVLVLAIVANFPPLITGEVAVVDHLNRPERIPEYWRAAAAHLDAKGDSTRVLELPGADFAAYRWGNTVDPVMPYLTDRPYVARELIPYGSEPSADLLNAFDRRLQEGLFEAEFVAPVARLLAAGDLNVRNDLEFERFRTPRPTLLWTWLTSPRPDGLAAPVPFGPSTPNRPASDVELLDETELGLPAQETGPPAIAAFAVTRPDPIIRVLPLAAPLIVAGDGEGLIDAAAAGLLDGTRAVRYAATVRDLELPADARLVVTDTNRLRARRWGTVRENVGYTESAVSTPLEADPADARLDLFPDAPRASFTVVDQRGVKAIRASRYGNPISYTPEDRPANALDGDLATAWRVGAFSDVTGERLRVDLAEPLAIDRVRIIQPLTGTRNRYITSIRLHLDDEQMDVDLDESSRSDGGQLVTFPGRRVERLELEVRETNIGRRARYDGLSGVGFAEVDIGDDGGVRVDEVIRMPTDLIDRIGADGAADPLFVMTRLRADPAVPVRSDEELQIKRSFRVPRAAQFEMKGIARVSPATSDAALDRVLGTPGPAEGFAVARSDARLPGSLRSRAAMAIDGDPATAWRPGHLDQTGHWIEVELPAAITIDHLDLQVIDDGRHSVPTRLRLDVDGQLGVRTLDVRAGGRLSFAPVRGRVFRVTVEAYDAVRSFDLYGDEPIDTPIAIAELGLPGLIVGSSSGPGPACRSDLVEVDGKPVAVRVVGTYGAAIARESLTMEACAPLRLDAGEHELRTAIGRDLGIDVDRLVLQPVSAATSPSRADGSATASVARSSRTSFTVDLADVDEPSWLVLSQSHNAGWRATADGDDLGAPQLVNGYANGWVVSPGTQRVELVWTPQRYVWAALAISALGALLCVAVVIGTRRTPRLSPHEALTWDRPRASRSRAELATGAVCALAAAAFAGPAAAAIVAAVVTVAAAHRRGAYVVVQQIRYDYPPDFAWPGHFHTAHVIASTAVVMVVQRVWVGARTAGSGDA